MTLPFTLSTVKIETRSGTGDRWEPASYSVSVAAADAVLGLPGESDLQTSQGDQERVDMVLHVNPGTPVTRLDRITDLQYGDIYEALWVVERAGLGLDHIRVGLKRVSGAQ